MTSQEQTSGSQSNASSSQTDIDSDVQSRSSSRETDASSRDGTGIDSNEMAASDKASLHARHKESLQAIVKAKANDPAPSRSSKKVQQKGKKNPVENREEDEQKVKPKRPRGRPRKVQSDAPFNKTTQRKWDDGLIPGGFGPNEVFGSVPVPTLPPAGAGYGFGMGVYDNYDHDCDASFKSWNASSPDMPS
ncbi:hypothetical protein F5Y01DRAFT_313489 [Xylaria sp. FL0043]|nr:hypothetical protein F5Y01DRAFT_313489 [Xylaria sp. FL0043]